MGAAWNCFKREYLNNVSNSLECTRGMNLRVKSVTAAGASGKTDRERSEAERARRRLVDTGKHRKARE